MRREGIKAGSNLFSSSSSFCQALLYYGQVSHETVLVGWDEMV
jgi:hypothetical protein